MSTIKLNTTYFDNQIIILSDKKINKKTIL